MDRWNDTPYMAGQCCIGTGVDCVGFIVAVMNEMAGREAVKRAEWPQDASMHDAKGSFRAMKSIAEGFEPYERVEDTREIEPGDIIVVGPQNGGPGHGMVVGPRENTIWHSTNIGVQMTGISFLWLTNQRIFRIYRYLRKDLWLSS